MRTDLSQYKDKQKLTLKKILWYFVSAVFFTNYCWPINFLKIYILRIFGTKIGRGVVIKPGVNIKYPWLLKIGNYVWIGENVWIDNLARVEIGDNSCISQGVMLLTGNHDYKKSTFDLFTEEIILADGVWIGAKGIVCPGVCCGPNSVLTAGSIACRNMEQFTIYQGNPAIPIRKREIDE